MRRKLAATAGTLATGLTLVLSAPGSAHAETTSGYVTCTTTGAYGEYFYSNYSGPGATINVQMSLTDTLADGNSVRVRMMSKDVNGAVTYYQWRANAGGANTTKKWTTTASHARGLFDIGIQVARFNSDGTLRNSCAQWS
ncbi:hypothetical protein AB4225_16960 [Streptomyces sp. 2RAF24]|uniref:hypothetical protein n=1 Tax=unclassified Streptomyces TaxID=2593676 RepID=UPI00340D3F84